MARERRLEYFVWFVSGQHSLTGHLIAESERLYEPDDVLIVDQPLAEHCGDLWHDLDTDEWWAVEAVPWATRRFDLAEKAGQSIRIYKAPVTPMQAFAAWAVAQTQIGRLYNVVGVACTYVLLRFGLHTAFQLAAFAALDCSQRVLQVLQAIDSGILPDLDPTNSTPARVEYHIAKAGWTPYDPGAARVEERAEHAD